MVSGVLFALVDNIRLVKFSLHPVWFIEKDLKISMELLWTLSLWVLLF
jgi:hypothetical protein